MQNLPVPTSAPYRVQEPQSLVGRLKEIDAKRPDFPGEHLIVLGLGTMLMMRGMRNGSLLRRMLLTAAGTALVGRAASGTGGVARLARMVKRFG
ncbi:hypothetical protein [Bordetella genomosp. 13]|uniref:Uncharacterized protein n=1 Tax=Bordetella genomosp. 13 TaxID=463040 RepID=A0A1W6Z8U7_9BORD|nr:hypothetical protein [Bordetella genomosp. 13]ARP93828.1 hypothetical protein CAL15_05160 [Bordetella genomosp. 13]